MKNENKALMKNEKKTALQRMRDKTINKKNLAGDTRGLSTVEYLILLVIIAVAGIAVWGRFATAVETKADTSTNNVLGM